ncbi:isoprenylcysteine carboxylmethyltransferase family protein [Mycobacterium sp. AMU20-3851]|uniref:methyltransferase family protein n=1 Tax=Mycobacterium sp. AMU20-3851 TaxID=3122055 RepID=UPI00375409A6
MKLVIKFIASTLAGLVFFGAVLFIPAGTVHYWQGWAYLVVFMITTLGPSVYLAVTDPATLQRRLHAGPTAETRPTQRLVAVGYTVASGACLIVSALDHRFGWSTVPTAVTIAGLVLVAVGLSAAQVVILQNRYAAANITVEADQPLVSTGLYAWVRHPMYSAVTVMMIGTPPALGSWWGLLVLIPMLAVLAVRILDEEALLTDRLPGYREYRTRVRHRLVPYLW